MTDPIVPGGAGLPEQQISAPGAQPGGQPEPPPEAPSEATSPWPPTEPTPPAPPAPSDGGAGYGMPAGGGFGTPIGSSWDSPPAGSPPPGSPSTGFTPGPALTPTSGRRGLKKRYIVIGAIVAVLVVGAFVFKDSLVGNPSDLAVGNCFDVPTTASPEDTVSSVQHHPCTESHTGEVIFVGNYTGSVTAYPAVSDFDTFVGSTCKPAFLTYVGKDLDSDPDLSIGYFYPLADGWTNGDHGVTCYVTRTDSGPMKSSVKGSGSPAASATP